MHKPEDLLVWVSHSGIAPVLQALGTCPESVDGHAGLEADGFVHEEGCGPKENIHQGGTSSFRHSKRPLKLCSMRYTAADFAAAGMAEATNGS